MAARRVVVPELVLRPGVARPPAARVVFVAVDFFAAAFVAVDFFAAVFDAVDFFVAVLLAAVFLAAVFLAAVFLAVPVPPDELVVLRPADVVPSVDFVAAG